jgi:hypothetical protein
MGERAWHISPSMRLAEPGAHVEDARRRDIGLGPLPRSTAHAWPGDAAIAHFTANSAVNCACVARDAPIAHFTANSAVNCACVPPATRRLRTLPRIARSTAHACPDDAAVAHFTAFSVTSPTAAAIHAGQRGAKSKVVYGLWRHYTSNPRTTESYLPYLAQLAVIQFAGSGTTISPGLTVSVHDLPLPSGARGDKPPGSHITRKTQTVQDEQTGRRNHRAGPSSFCVLPST